MGEEKRVSIKRSSYRELSRLCFDTKTMLMLVNAQSTHNSIEKISITTIGTAQESTSLFFRTDLSTDLRVTMLLVYEDM